MSKSTRRKSRKNNAETQTVEVSPSELQLEVARLMEKIRHLEIENATLKNSMVVKVGTEPEDSTHDQVVVKTEKVTEVENDTVLIKRRETLLLENHNKSKRANKIGVPGCSCKGHCANKICGCIKKGQTCGTGCKCNEVICQNQSAPEANKENMENVIKDIKVEYNKVEDNEVEHNKVEDNKVEDNKVEDNEEEGESVKNKHLEKVKKKKHLFSPFHNGKNLNFNINDYCFEPLHFGPSKKTTFLSDDETIIKDTKEKKTKKQITERRGRAKENALNVTVECSKRLRSASNEERKKTFVMHFNEPTLKKSISTEIEINKNNKSTKINQEQYLQNITNIPTIQKRLIKRNPSAMENEENTQSEAEMYTTCVDSQRYLNDSSFSDDNSFDPTKPKHQLPRTPPGRPKSNSPCTPNVFLNSFGENSMVKEIIEPIPAEFYQPQIDWEKHKAELIECKECQRKFHPLRIKKHELCCKKI